VHPRVPQRVALIGLVAGIVLAIGPVVLWSVGTSVADVPATGPAPQVAPAALRDPATGATAPSVRPAASAYTVAPAAPDPQAPAPPVRIRAADVGVDAPVVDTGVDEQGGMAVPHDIRTIGWYRFGVGPGATTGSAVLAGHVDDRLQGRGAFYRLRDLAVGSPVEVILADGTVVRYRVSAVEHVAKTALPAGEVFARDGPPRLALVTCGGAFDRAAGGYTDNVVVTAAPEGPS
jgi:Sortase domain